eukprot:TCONS_00029595-protein
MSETNKTLFKDIKFYLAEENSKLSQILKDGGAQKEFYIVPVANLIIADNVHFQNYEQAKESNLPIVTSGWVHMCVKCDVLLPYAAFSLKKDQIFANTVICASQMPSEDRNALLGMVLFHGGKFVNTLSSVCTHLIVGQPKGKKYEAALQNKINVVTPDWIKDSILKETQQLVKEYEPLVKVVSKISQENIKQTTPNMISTATSSAFMTPVTPGQIATDALSLPTNQNKENIEMISASTNQCPPDLLKGFKIYFCDYEDRLPANTFNIWRTAITKVSGVIKDTYGPDVTHVLCLHQQSPIFKKALEDKKKIATAYWLNDVLVAKKVFPPKTPLHLPVPFTDTIAGMKSSVSLFETF